MAIYGPYLKNMSSSMDCSLELILRDISCYFFNSLNICPVSSVDGFIVGFNTAKRIVGISLNNFS